MKRILVYCILAVMFSESVLAGRTFVTAKGIFRNASIEMDAIGKDASLFIKTKDRKIYIEWKDLSTTDRNIFLLRPIGMYRNGKYHYHDMCQIKGVGKYFITVYSYDMKDPYFKGNRLRYMIIDINDLDVFVLKELGKEKYSI